MDPIYDRITFPHKLIDVGEKYWINQGNKLQSLLVNSQWKDATNSRVSNVKLSNTELEQFLTKFCNGNKCRCQ